MFWLVRIPFSRRLVPAGARYFRLLRARFAHEAVCRLMLDDPPRLRASRSSEQRCGRQAEHLEEGLP
jgi:hypothetical protein